MSCERAWRPPPREARELRRSATFEVRFARGGAAWPPVGRGVADVLDDGAVAADAVELGSPVPVALTVLAAPRWWTRASRP